MKGRSRLVPLIVASPMFLQNIDTSAMAIALPSIAASLQVPALQLNLIITTYLLSLAVFLPMSAWLADRFGAKRMFCMAIVLFSLASALCGTATSLATLVVCRIIQGMGAAMMVPVGRLILVRSVPPSELITAMVWYTVPPTIGRLAGPLVGGAIVSVTSWHWIFFVNIPFGVVAVLLALVFVEDSRPEGPPPAFDVAGFLLIAIGLAAMLGALETAGKGLIPGWLSALAAAVGASALGLYGLRNRRRAESLIDLRVLAFRTFRTNALGAVPLRLAVLAVPFLLPFMLQMGFGLSPLASGLLTAASAVGALCTRGIMRWAIDRHGFRRLLLGATVLTSAIYMSYALFGPATPHALMFCVLFLGGVLTSICMVSLNTLGFAELPKERMSHATVVISMAQQLTAGFGVVLAAALLALFSRSHGGDGVHLLAQDFSATFVALGLTALLSLFSFVRLKPDDGDELR